MHLFFFFCKKEKKEEKKNAANRATQNIHINFSVEPFKRILFI